MESLVCKRKEVGKKVIFLILVLCGIITNISMIFGEEKSTIKDVEYDIPGPVDSKSYKYKIDTSCIRYHVKCNGYDKKIGDTCSNNFSILDSRVASTDSKTDGYGQYTFKLDSLQGFLEYCYGKNREATIIASNTVGINEGTSCTYEKLVAICKRTLSTTAKKFMTNFWTSMMGLNEVFYGYQDSYFFKENTYNAIDKVKTTLRASNLSYGNLREGNKHEENTSTVEYLTLLTTYMYSINREEKLERVGKGDLVPFLYYAENAGCYDAREIAKYAYVALIEEFLRVSGKNYWLNEYEQVFKNAYANLELDYDLETLEEWYDECYAKYKNDRGLKQNPLLGSDINTIIGSNYSINSQVEATEEYIEDFFNELGIDTDFRENMARNELMAKYMMENEYVSDTIEDYCVEVSFIEENLQRGTQEPQNTHTAVLSDFQVIDFKHDLSTDGDKDNDTLNDSEELGPIKWVDITSFVQKSYDDAVISGKSHKSTFEEQVDAMATMNGGYYDINGRYVDGQVKKVIEGGIVKVYYKTYDYISNPALKDTDFDGMNDNSDEKPLSGTFSGQTDIERGNDLKVGYTQDYRYFFINNKKYNDELAQMSLIISNLANDEKRKIKLYQGGVTVGMINIGGSSVGDLNIREYMSKIGFTMLSEFSIAEGKGTAYIGYKIIDYYGKEKLVLSVFIGGFFDENSYKNYVIDLSNIDERYEIIVKEITNKIDELKTLPSIKTYFENQDMYSYWLTGKNISGAIANEVATKLNNTDNIYCYTFAVPNASSNITSGGYIKTIINEDDLLPKINNEDEGYVDGDIYNKSIYWDLIPEYKQYIGSPNSYKGNYKKTNNIRQGILETKETFKVGNSSMLSNFIYELSTYLSNLLENKNGKNTADTLSITLNNLDSLCETEDYVREMKKYDNEIIWGNSTKAYWCLVKSLDGYDQKGYYDGDYTKYENGETRTPKTEMIIDDNVKKEKFKEILYDNFFKEFVYGDLKEVRESSDNSTLKDKIVVNPQDATIVLLAELYDEIFDRKNSYEANKAYIRIIGNLVYNGDYIKVSSNGNTLDKLKGSAKNLISLISKVPSGFGWMATAGYKYYSSEVLDEIKEYTKYNKIYNNNISKFDDNVKHVYGRVIQQNSCCGLDGYYSNPARGFLDSKNNSIVPYDECDTNMIDLPHMCATISSELYDNFSQFFSRLAGEMFNGVFDEVLNAGFIGDICGTNLAKPSMRNDDYKADLDAINFGKRIDENKNDSLYEIFDDYYNSDINRADEFIKNIEKKENSGDLEYVNLNKYKQDYLRHLIGYGEEDSYKEIRFNYYMNNEFIPDEYETNDVINRINYYNNFLQNLRNHNNEYIHYSEYPYHEYEGRTK